MFSPIKGKPAAFFIASTTVGVPTRTLVPVSTIPEFKFHDFPAILTLSTPITHHSYYVTG
jgi:hypothetical protein